MKFSTVGPRLSKPPGTWMCSQLWIFQVFKSRTMYMYLCNFCNDIEANNLPSVDTMLYCISEAEVLPVQQMVPYVYATPTFITTLSFCY